MKIEQFLTRLDVKKVPCNYFIFVQGDFLQYAYVIKSGQVALSVVNQDGSEYTVDVLGQGDMFGDQFLLLGIPSTVTAQIVPYQLGRRKNVNGTTAWLYVIHKSNFQSLLNNPQFMAEFNKLNVNRLLNSWDLLSFQRGAPFQRIKRIVRYLNNRDLHVDQARIASMCNSTRETVNRVLHSHTPQKVT